MHLIKRQTADAAGHLFGHRLNGIHCALRLGPGDPGMNLLHKAMKMHAPDRGAKTAGKHIHQHRLTAPHTAPKVDPIRRRRGLAKPPPFARLAQREPQSLKLVQRGFLRRVMLERSRGDGVLIGVRQIHAPPIAARRAGCNRAPIAIALANTILRSTVRA